jgi:uncharacterized protein
MGWRVGAGRCLLAAMKRILPLLCAVVLAPVAFASVSGNFVSNLSENERRVAGVDQLTEEQRAALNFLSDRWVELRSESFIRAEVARAVAEVRANLPAGKQDAAAPTDPIRKSLHGQWESANRSIIEQLHTSRPYSRALLESSAFTEALEWWAAGKRDCLPWAGTWIGKAGVTDFFRALGAEMVYETFETREIISSGEEVVTVIYASGHAKRTGRAFAGEIVRIYTFDLGKIVKVRSYYDTAEYEQAVAAKP